MCERRGGEGEDREIVSSGEGGKSSGSISGMCETDLPTRCPQDGLCSGMRVISPVLLTEDDMNDRIVSQTFLWRLCDDSARKEKIWNGEKWTRERHINEKDVESQRMQTRSTIKFIRDTSLF